MKFSKNWKSTRKIYKYFVRDSDCDLCFCKDCEESQYVYESHGGEQVDYSEKSCNGRYNGFAVGKHKIDLNLSFWKEGLFDGEILKIELYEDFLTDEYMQKHQGEYVEVDKITQKDLKVPMKLFNIVRKMKGISKDGLFYEMRMDVERITVN